MIDKNNMKKSKLTRQRYILGLFFLIFTFRVYAPLFLDKIWSVLKTQSCDVSHFLLLAALLVFAFAIIVMAAVSFSGKEINQKIGSVFKLNRTIHGVFDMVSICVTWFGLAALGIGLFAGLISEYDISFMIFINILFLFPVAILTGSIIGLKFEFKAKNT